MERKELKQILCLGHHLYDKAEADSVMDRYEKRIKELRQEGQDMFNHTQYLEKRIKELEAEVANYREELDHERTQFAISLDEQEKKSKSDFAAKMAKVKEFFDSYTPEEFCKMLEDEYKIKREKEE